MQVTYQAASNTTTNGVALGAAGQDVKVYHVSIGIPVANGNIILYNKTVAFSGDTSNIAWKKTLPATLSSSYTYVYQTEFDFPTGLQIDGGNLMIDQTMNVTVSWDVVGEQAES